LSTSNHTGSNVRYVGHEATLSHHHANLSHRATQQFVPTLSPEGHQTAMESGLTYLYEQIMTRYSALQQQGSQIQNTTTMKTTASHSSAIYVGDQFVWVYIREDDHIFSVLVRP
jgi:hypothetical protein